MNKNYESILWSKEDCVPNFLNIVLTLIGVFDVLRQRLHDNDQFVKAKNRKVFCLQEILKQKWRTT